ncbi:MAG: hypothetical protein EOP42_27915, partial [Sphingobacteriaceae bacterium]
MFNTTELNDKLVSELREIAKGLGIAQAEELRKQDLIAQISNSQTPAAAPAEKAKPGRKPRVAQPAAMVAEPEIPLQTLEKEVVKTDEAPVAENTAAEPADAEDKPRRRIRSIKTAKDSNADAVPEINFPAAERVLPRSEPQN